VIVFGICAGPTDRYERLAKPGLEQSREPGSIIMVRRGERSIFQAYNQILEAADRMTGVEGVVLLHDDVLLDDPDVCNSVRTVFADAQVAIAGVIGSRNPSNVSWASSPPIGYAIDYYTRDHSRRVVEGSPGAGTHDVDTLDGLFLAFSPWAVHHLRFDPRGYPGFDGYDADICAQARHAGKRVTTIDVQLEHKTAEPSHRVMGGGSPLRQADFTWKGKWRTDQPWWRRAYWRYRGRFLRVEYRLRRKSWDD